MSGERGGWRLSRRYRLDEPEGRAVLDGLAQRLAGLDLLDTPIWVFDAERCQCLWANPPGLLVWRAASVADLMDRDVATTQSEAVYALLNDYLRRVDAGGEVGVSVTLDPQGTSRRFYQTHHVVTLADGRKALLIEARNEPPAEEMLAFAANHTMTIGLYDHEGRLISGNPPFVAIAKGHPMNTLRGLLPQTGDYDDWFARLTDENTVAFETELGTDRGRRWFRCELRRVLSGERAAQAMLSLFDVTESKLALAEAAHRIAVDTSLREKETLLQEIHHRVKNNLQIISSLLMLQADKTSSDDARRALEESAQRVISMALIHQHLYGVESLELIDLSDYARDLARSLRAIFAPRARVLVEGDMIELNIDIAVPVGLILNELVTNALKYGVANAQADDAPGQNWDVLVTITATSERVHITVSDRGPGLPADYDPSRSGTLGLELIRALTRQLRASFEATTDGGARFDLDFPRAAVR